MKTDHPRRARAVGVALALLAVSAASAAAQEGSTAPPEWGDRDDEARALFEAGASAYDGGHFADAESYFRRSYELSGRPALLYNIATAAERANHDPEALEAYRQFIERTPADNPLRGRVQVRIAALEEIVGEGEAASTPVDTTSGGTDATPWILFGASLAITIGGAVMVAIAAADVASVENAATHTRWSAVSEAYARSEPLSIAGFVALGVGLAGAAGSLAWALVPSNTDDPAAVQFEIRPGGLLLSGSWR